jgi:hypothetical protein
VTQTDGLRRAAQPPTDLLIISNHAIEWRRALLEPVVCGGKKRERQRASPKICTSWINTVTREQAYAAYTHAGPTVRDAPFKQSCVKLLRAIVGVGPHTQKVVFRSAVSRQMTSLEKVSALPHQVNYRNAPKVVRRSASLFF